MIKRLIPMLFICTTLSHAADSDKDRCELNVAPTQTVLVPEPPKTALNIVDLLNHLVKDPGKSLSDPEFKKMLGHVAQSLQNEEKLEPNIRKVFSIAEKAGKLPPDLKPEQKEFVISMLLNAIQAELQQRGYDEHQRNYETWEQLSQRLNGEIESLGITGAGVQSDHFWKTHAVQTNTTHHKASKAEILVDGPASFAKRGELIDSAKKEILIMSWSIEDDETGEWLKQKLLKKISQGVSVKVMVDGQTAKRPGYKMVLQQLEEAQIEVIRWISTDSSREFDGQHRKYMIVDGESLVGGGLNHGNHYSHMGPKEGHFWRDTDLSFEGPAVQATRNQFVELWNEQISGTLHADRTPLEANTLSTTGQRNMSVVNHIAGQGENILRSIVLAIEAAERQVLIENAYFIVDPVVERALTRSLARGVKVVIATNSAESIDEPTVTRPILKSLNKLFEVGASIYTKPGKLETLHSKVMAVDNHYAWVGSQNLHPRSYRYEGEVIFVSSSPTFVSKVNAMLRNDFESFIPMTEAFDVEESDLLDFQEELFFDQF
ncbi:phosphatidylserine/phosphatidylglycerophosphate/cardiolipin synthase family protein [bacterium]|nr:phosphatidylserine/phosphatidylglycerophosphate/cardiolipin synthase family protein [bacterium]